MNEEELDRALNRALRYGQRDNQMFSWEIKDVLGMLREAHDRLWAQCNAEIDDLKKD